ncbi:GTPase activating factor [Amphichorda felina]
MTRNMDGQPPQRPPSGAGANLGASTTDSTDWFIPSQQQPAPNSPVDHGRNAMERPSGASLRAALGPPTSNGSSSNHGGGVSLRAVTPDMIELPDSATSAASDTAYVPRGLPSHETSPRSMPGGVSRRQGIVFNDSFSGDSYDTGESSPPHGNNSSGSSRLASGTVRPRTRTMDTAMLTGQRAAAATMDQRHRVGSVSSSSGSQAAGDDQRQPAAGLESTGFPTIMGGRSIDAAAAAFAMKADKKGTGKRLVKRQSSRPTSPHVVLPPLIDSLPFPMPTETPTKLLLLMKTLCGKMRGEVEYQGEMGGTWHSGVAYIDDERGCLMFDSGQNGPFHIPLVADLRGCRILPVNYPAAGKICIELVSSSPIIEVLLHPLVPSEFDLWLAALLCWQQLRPTALKLSSTKTASPVAPVRPELKRRGVSDGPKSTNIIKVGKMQVWDKGPASSPKSMLKRSSTRDPRSPHMSWRRISCILHDNGEFKLMAENDITIIAVIDLAQLSRCAIQQLDRTVLDEEYCIAIFPIYAPVSSQLSIYRPVYLALDNRVHVEVWFALLRAFAVPDVYKLDDPTKDLIHDVNDLGKDYAGEVFRVEKTILVRVTEAKIRAKISGSEPPVPEKPGKGHDPDPLVGNYLAEVILDGEVRARTTTKTATKNPFWREDCEFIDLPSTIPHLSVVLKRVDSASEGPGHHSLAGSLKGPTEVICGSVELPLTPTTAGVREHELWLQILDDKQESIGSMLIKVVHEENVVLLAKEYLALGELLHNFSAGLTSLISTALPGQLRRLAELFLNIFQVSGTASEWLMALVEDEIDGIGSQSTLKKYRFNSRLKSNESAESTVDRELILRDMSKNLAGEANLLFRGNTLLTQSLELHMRRLGKEFLEETLQDKLYEINELNPDCEVDPSKISQANGELDQHWHRLIDVTTDVWLCIAASANKLNPELRSILKYVRAVAEDRYGDFLRPVAYTSVSGFLFLRFICPAILSPKLFGLLRDHPRPRAQRTFTLIAKALQKMANLSTFGKREEWMEPMNRFLTAQRSRFRDYIDLVCDVPAERGLRTLHASYSTPVTILSRLGPTACEGFPSLPYLIDQSRNYASLVKLWVDLMPSLSDSKRVAIEGDLLAFSKLCKGLQARADACLARHEGQVKASTSTAETDELADILEQASLIESLSYSYSGSTAWNEAMHPPGSSGSDTREDPTGRRSKDLRRGRDTLDVKKPGGTKHSSGSGGGTTKAKKGRTILSGIMRMGGRAESPDSKEKK